MSKKEKNQVSSDGSKTNLPQIDDTNYEELANTILEKDSEMKNISFSKLVRLSEYLQTYRSNLVRSQKFKKAKEIVNLKIKVDHEIRLQTKQLEQFQNKSSKDSGNNRTKKGKNINQFDEETEKLEKDLLMKQANELHDFESYWNTVFDDSSERQDSDYLAAKNEIEAKFQKEIDDFKTSREEQKAEEMKKRKANNLSSVPLRPRSYQTGRSINSQHSNRSQKSTQSLQMKKSAQKAITRPTTAASVASAMKRCKNITLPNYSLFFPLYTWIHVDGKNSTNTSSRANAKSLNNNYNSDEQNRQNSKSDPSSQNNVASKNGNTENQIDQENLSQKEELNNQNTLNNVLDDAANNFHSKMLDDDQVEKDRQAENQNSQQDQNNISGQKNISNQNNENDIINDPENASHSKIADENNDQAQNNETSEKNIDHEVDHNSQNDQNDSTDRKNNTANLDGIIDLTGTLTGEYDFASTIGPKKLELAEIPMDDDSIDSASEEASQETENNSEYKLPPNLEEEEKDEIEQSKQNDETKKKEEAENSEPKESKENGQDEKGETEN